MTEVVAFGECMLEVGLSGPGQAALGYAGDTFNAAVYLRRLGLSVTYATAVGSEDPFSDGILRLMGDESMDASLVRRVPGRLPGVYAIDRDVLGERRFFYWRSESPARDFFALADLAAVRRAAEAAKLVYLSGISLAILRPDGRAKLIEVLEAARSAGARIAFDPNHRPPLWESPETAQETIGAVLPLCHYVSCGVSDLNLLYGEAPELRAAEWAAHGAEVVLRDERHAIAIYEGAQVTRMSPEPAVRALDTTGAGDAFNAGYLAARMAGQPPRSAVLSGRRLANLVVQHIGAIIPRSAMPEQRAAE